MSKRAYITEFEKLDDIEREAVAALADRIVNDLLVDGYGEGYGELRGDHPVGGAGGIMEAIAEWINEGRAL